MGHRIKNYCDLYYSTPDHLKKKEGSRYGTIVLIRLVGRDQASNQIWLARCDCGQVVIKRMSSLHKPSVSTCWDCEIRRRSGRNSGNKHPRWTGLKGMCGSAYYRAKNGAQSRDLPFELTIADMAELLEQQKYRCALSGLLLTADTHKRNASLDRIDSTRGYTLDNVQWVDKDVNRIKQHLPQDRFLFLCEMIAKETRRKKRAISIDSDSKQGRRQQKRPPVR